MQEDILMDRILAISSSSKQRLWCTFPHKIGKVCFPVTRIAPPGRNTHEWHLCTIIGLETNGSTVVCISFQMSPYSHLFPRQPVELAFNCFLQMSTEMFSHHLDSHVFNWCCMEMVRATIGNSLLSDWGQYSISLFIRFIGIWTGSLPKRLWYPPVCDENNGRTTLETWTAGQTVFLILLPKQAWVNQRNAVRPTDVLPLHSSSFPWPPKMRSDGWQACFHSRDTHKHRILPCVWLHAQNSRPKSEWCLCFFTRHSQLHEQ